MNIEFEYDDAIERLLHAHKPTMLCHIVNNSGGWGRGFVVPLGKKIPKAEEWYRAWYKNGYYIEAGRSVEFALGNVQFVRLDNGCIVANMCAQEGYDDIPIRYWAITSCMREILAYAMFYEYDIIMPRIGCGLGGGSWDKVDSAIMDALPKIKVFDFN